MKPTSFLIYWITILILKSTCCHCHIATLMEKGFSHPPLLTHSRVQRGPFVPGEEREFVDQPAKLYHLNPSYQHRSKMSGLLQVQMGKPINRNLIDGNDYSEEGESRSATFTPFIGAHALSNLGQFFQQLRENIEAVKSKDTRDKDDGLSIESRGERKGVEKHSDSGFVEVSDEQNEDDEEDEDNLSTQKLGYDSNRGHYNFNNLRGFNYPKFEEGEYGAGFLPKSPKYNPRWQLTTMGLGRRRRK